MSTTTGSEPQDIAKLAEEWKLAAAEATQWAEQVAALARQIHPHLSAFESSEHSKKAADLALQAFEATGDKTNKLRRSAANSAKKAAELAHLVIRDLNQVEQAELRAQALTWAKAQEIADKLARLSTEGAGPSAKEWWQFWK